VSCVFPTDESPFELIDDTYIKGHYHDTQQRKPKYRTEEKEGRLQIERMKMHLRTDYYYHEEKVFNIIPDSDDFQMLVELIMDSKKSFHIDGRAGCGKTTLIKKLREIKKSGILFLPEPVDEWNKIVDSQGVTILSKYYANQTKYAFSFQMMAFITRIKQLSEAILEYSNKDVIIITERCIFTDREIFAKMLFDDGKIEDIEYSIYLQWFDHFIKDIKIHGIIYVKSDPKVCFQRIGIRNREGESIPIEYLISLDQYHDAWLLSKGNKLILDGNMNYSNNLPEVWINEIDTYLKK
jgi:deoxyadenosine/deoxycytidine kinase